MVNTIFTAKARMRAKLSQIPPEVAMKIVREGLRQKQENPSGMADWLASSGLFEKYRQWQGYRRYGPYLRFLSRRCFFVPTTPPAQNFSFRFFFLKTRDIPIKYPMILHP